MPLLRFFCRLFSTLVPLVLVSILASCGSTCSSVDDMNMTKIEVTVPASPANLVEGNPSTYWVDSGFFIASSEKLVATVRGGVDLCDDSSNIQLPWRISPTTSLPPTTDTGIKVLPGAIVMFQAIEKDFVITNCESPPDGVYVHDVAKCKTDYQGTTYRAAISPKDIPMTPADNILLDPSYVWVRGGSAVILPEHYSWTKRVNDKDVTISSAFPKEPDPVDRYLQGINDPNVAMSELKKYRCGPGLNISGTNYSLNKSQVTAYELNKFCGNISDYNDTTPCTNWPGGVSVNGDRLRSAMTLMHDSCYENKPIVPAGETPPTKEDVGVDLGDFGGQTINSPVAKGFYIWRLNGIVKDSNDMNIYSFPTGNEPEHTKDPLRINAKIGYQYIIPNSVSGNLHIVIDHRVTNVYNLSEAGRFTLGGFHIKVSTSCPNTNNLYVTATSGRNADGTFMRPTVAPGGSGTYRLKLEATGNPPRFNDPILNGSDQGGVITGRVYFGVNVGNAGHSHASGAYQVVVKKPGTGATPFSTVMNWAIEPIQDTLYGAKFNGVRQPNGIVPIIYNRIIRNINFQKMVRTVIALYIAIYALLYLMGLMQLSMKELVVMSVKIGIITLIASPNSWEFFYKGYFYIFSDGLPVLVAVMTTPPDIDIDTASSPFIIFDNALTKFFSLTPWLQIFGLMLAGPIGYFYSMMYIWAAVAFIGTAIGTVMIYMLSLVVSGIIVSLFPLFFLTAPFKYTSKIWQASNKTLLVCLLQPMFLLVGYGFLMPMIQSVLDSVFGFGICSKCALQFEIKNLVPFCLAHMPLPDTLNNATNIESRISASSAGTPSYGFMGLTVLPTTVLLFVTLCSLLKKLLIIMPTMAESLVGAFGTSLSAAAHGMQQSALGWVGRSDSQVQQRVHAKADAARKTGSVNVGSKKRDGAGGPSGSSGGTTGSRGGQVRRGAGDSTGLSRDSVSGGTQPSGGTKPSGTKDVARDSATKNPAARGDSVSKGAQPTDSDSEQPSPSSNRFAPPTSSDKDDAINRPISTSQDGPSAPNTEETSTPPSKNIDGSTPRDPSAPTLEEMRNEPSAPPHEEINTPTPTNTGGSTPRDPSAPTLEDMRNEPSAPPEEPNDSGGKL